MQNRKNKPLFMILAQFDKSLKKITCLYGILGQFLCAQFSAKKIGCAKDFADRRCEFNPVVSH